MDQEPPDDLVVYLGLRGFAVEGTRVEQLARVDKRAIELALGDRKDALKGASFGTRGSTSAPCVAAFASGSTP